MYTQPINNNRAAYDFYLHQATPSTVNVVVRGRKLESDRFDNDNPHSFNACITCANRADADKIVALFPKFVNVRVGTYYRMEMTTVSLQVEIGASKVNKGANETGVKRIKRFVAVCRANDIVLDKLYCAGNSSEFTVDAWMEKQ